MTQATTQSTDILAEFSRATAERARDAARHVVAIAIGETRHLTGTLWNSDTIVASAQALPARDAYDIVLPGGARAKAQAAGRDPATNIAALKLAQPASGTAPGWSKAELGALALAFGSDGEGGATARMGLVALAGPEWHSQTGGRIDARIVLDMRLVRAEEGGPVFDAAGARLGITTFGPRRQVLVIPSSTIDRVVPLLIKDGRVARGWLGVALQPVAVPEPLRESAGAPSGLMVMQIAEQGPAALAGIRAGDIVVAVDGHPARRFRRIAATLGPDSIGRQAQLRVLRGGEVLALSATITARPAA